MEEVKKKQKILRGAETFSRMSFNPVALKESPPKKTKASEEKGDDSPPAPRERSNSIASPSTYHHRPSVPTIPPLTSPTRQPRPSLPSNPGFVPPPRIGMSVDLRRTRAHRPAAQRTALSRAAAVGGGGCDQPTLHSRRHRGGRLRSSARRRRLRHHQRHRRPPLRSPRRQAVRTAFLRSPPAPAQSRRLRAQRSQATTQRPEMTNPVSTPPPAPTSCDTILDSLIALLKQQLYYARPQYDLPPVFSARDQHLHFSRYSSTVFSVLASLPWSYSSSLSVLLSLRSHQRFHAEAESLLVI